MKIGGCGSFLRFIDASVSRSAGARIRLNSETLRSAMCLSLIISRCLSSPGNSSERSGLWHRRHRAAYSDLK